MELIERTEQAAHLSGLFAECSQRRGHVVLMDGPPASGKTRLLRAFTEQASASGALVLGAACSAAEQALPFGVLSQLFHSAALPAAVAEQLDRLLEEAGSRPAAGGSAPSTADPDTAQLFHRLSLALLAVAAETPTVLAVDDIRHADPQSADCLLYLVRRLGPSHILLLLTDDADPRPAHAGFRAELLRQPYFRRIRLSPLSPRGVEQLLTAQLGQDEADQLVPAFVAASGGNLVLLQALIEDHLSCMGVRPQGYGEALLGQLRNHDAVALQVARALAVLGPGASADDVCRLTRAGQEPVDRALAALTASGLLENGYLRHSVAQSAILRDLPPEVRSDLHHRAAVLLHQQDAPATDIGRQLLEAGSTRHQPWAVAVLLEAAEQAVLDGRTPTAARFLELALDSCPAAQAQERAAIRARLLQVEWQSNPLAAVRHLEPLASAARAGHLDQRERITLITQLLWQGRLAEATGALDRLREPEHRTGADQKQGAEAAVELRDTELWLSWAHPPLSRQRRPRTEPPRRPGPLVTPAIDPWLSPTAALADALVRGRDHEAVDQAEQVLRDLGLVRETAWAEEATALALSVLNSTDRAADTRTWCDRISLSPNAKRSPRLRALLAGYQAEASLRLGNLAAASRQAQAALCQMSPKAWGVGIGLPLGSLILAATRLGRFDEAAGHLTQPVPEAMLQSRYGLNYLYARGHYHLATNHSHAALSDFLSCGELMLGWGLDVPGLAPWRTGAAEAWQRLDNHDQAKRLVYDQLGRPGSTRARTRGLSLRLLAASSPAARKPQLLTESLELFEECGDRYEQARVLADLSQAYYTLGDSRRARMLFRRARHLADACGAAPLSQALLSAPPQLSGSTPTQAAPEDAEGSASLTDSERRIASLAVGGYTNREIATKLYVTASTVEQHLTRVYRKLGVKGRRDLPVGLEPARV